ncbi:MAG TPA: 3-hydroxybutyrate oligomer hydrolase family protein [Anaeromyxobacter sp.]|nr:3-hydroxybutyrate oligomer hydrolase family protein [Anaeromyxobacter sp.]
MPSRCAALRAPRFPLAAILLASFLAPAAARAVPKGDPCAAIEARIASRLAGVSCFASTDLTTSNPATTPANNSLAGAPAGAFTPVTDRAVIAPATPLKTPITKVVPGVQLDAALADDPTGQSRFLLRVPDDWNGRLVVAGASGTRSEFNGDFAWSDYVVQKGYAYASQNKGVWNLRITSLASATPPNDLACRLNPSSTVWVNFFDNDPGKEFTQWGPAIVAAAALARDALVALKGAPPRFTYAVGTSNGGYQVRRAIELAPHVFDGGVDWEGTFVDEGAPNILTDLPPAILNFPDYVASGFSSTSTAAKNILAAGYPPDIVSGTTPPTSLWGLYNAQFWEVTQCQWQKRLDPTYDTYGSGTGTYNYVNRLSESDVGAQLAAFANTGRLLRPLITIAGTMDALLPINHHARAYARKVAAVRAADLGRGPDDERRAPYRLYEVQNGNHIETFQLTFPQLEIIEPHAQRAFDLLVDNVEKRVPLPPDQCIARGGAISASPAQPGHCAALFVP